jgi:co-chaperonin GroES (HSP10)
MPLGMRVLVRIIPSEDRSAAGLYLPPGAKDAIAQAAYAEVVEVARANADDPEEDGFGSNVSGIPEGSRVLFRKDEGVPIPWDEELRLVDVKEILAVVEEFGLDDAH